ncbi:MAG: mercuric transporter MerT family protein [Candidatus Anammoxibacter sp.]
MKTRSVTTLAGTIVAAILASSCCIGPLILAGLGIGSVGVFSPLGKYRPIFMLVTFAFIGVAFYFTYRKKNETDACCATKTNTIKKVTLWVIAIIAICLLFFPYFFDFLIR